MCALGVPKPPQVKNLRITYSQLALCICSSVPLNLQFHILGFNQSQIQPILEHTVLQYLLLKKTHMQGDLCCSRVNCIYDALRTVPGAL